MPGVKVNPKVQARYAFLENDEIVSTLLDFDEGGVRKVRLNLPSIHCSSCIWLLENLGRLLPGIAHSQVNFQRKEISILYYKNQVSFKQVAELLHTLGYPPSIQLDALDRKKRVQTDWTLLYKMGVAGFCSANIMLLSFPEYLGMETTTDKAFAHLFTFLSLALSIPVIFYSSVDYFVSAFKGLRSGLLNLEVPIALGIAAVFIRSVYEVLWQVGPGYFDSLTGLIFFLLIGKWYQQKTYNYFSFERDYHSYFPLAATVVRNDKEEHVLLKDLKHGDELLIRNQELIPADSVLLEGEARVNYAFVTGEQRLVPKIKGELVFAGGRQEGGSIRVKLVKNVSNSYLLQLWNNEVFGKNTNAYLSSFVLKFSKYFVYATLLIAFSTFVFWYFADPTRMLFAVTAVLLVACPCALALSLPFALSNCLRILGKNGLYLKNADTVEKLSEINTIVFDKTGTLTEGESQDAVYMGVELSRSSLIYLRSTLRNSTHPISRLLYHQLGAEILPCESFLEFPGLGIESRINGHIVRIGSSTFINGVEISVQETRIYVEIDREVMGYFRISHAIRNNVRQMLSQLTNEKYKLNLLSGDSDSERKFFADMFPADSELKFRQTPEDKLHFIQETKSHNASVMMLGDGLNDAGALKASDVGVAVCDNINSFVPSCDAILLGNNLHHLPRFIKFAKKGVWVVKASLVLSVLYNFIGLYFAVQATLTPLVAAILMPLSSVSVVLFVVLLTNYFGRRILKP
jgi:Cu+-exporting ATPase